MELRFDDSGFLISGESVSLSGEKERLQLLRAIKDDTSALVKAVTEAATPRITRSPAPAPDVAARTARVARTAANDAGTQGQQPAQQQVQQRSESARGVRAPNSEAKRAATPLRGADGRFQSGGAGSEEKAQEKTGARRLLAGLGDVMESIKSGFGRIEGTGDSVDPAIDAAKELGSILAPVTKPVSGLMGLMGRAFSRRPAEAVEKVAVPWYRRIWSELRDINESVDNQDGGKSMLGGLLAGLAGLLGGMLLKIPGAGLLGSLFGKDDGLPGLGGKGGGPTGKAGKAGGLLGKAGGMLKRLPFVGALLAGGMALGSIFGVGGGTTEERFKGAGGGIGAIIGGAIGTLLGPVGTVVGGMLGDLIGTQIGEWLSTVNWGEVGKSITGAWSTVTDGASKMFDTAAGWFKEKAAAAGEAVKEVASAVAEKVAPVVNSAKETATKGYEALTVQGGRLAGMLDKGYRHKERFDGIKGGESLAKYGSYTNDEADRIRQLKTSGANTSANLKGGMPQDIRNKIIAQATAAGLNPEDMLQVAALESGGNPNAISSTGATGVYQMTGQTATGLGITNRFDADQNIAGGMKLAQENANVLRKRGLAVNRDNLYMMHQLGPKAATDLIQGAAQGKNLNQLSEATQAAANLNYGRGAKTAKDYLAKNSVALDARLGQVSKTTPPTLAAPTSAAPTASAVPPVATAAAPLDKQALASVPTAPRKIGDNSKKSDPIGVMAAPLTQNIADRGLAQAATGGIGMNLGAR